MSEKFKILTQFVKDMSSETPGCRNLFICKRIFKKL